MIADIPGLIEGASEGAGLGHQFLRHLARTRVLLHLVDVAPTGPDASTGRPRSPRHRRGTAPLRRDLYEKPRWLVLNKLDMVDDPKALEELFVHGTRLDRPGVLVLGADRRRHAGTGLGAADWLDDQRKSEQAYSNKTRASTACPEAPQDPRSLPTFRRRDPDRRHRPFADDTAINRP